MRKRKTKDRRDEDDTDSQSGDKKMKKEGLNKGEEKDEDSHDGESESDKNGRNGGNHKSAESKMALSTEKQMSTEFGREVAMIEPGGPSEYLPENPTEHDKQLEVAGTVQRYKRTGEGRKKSDQGKTENDQNKRNATIEGTTQEKDQAEGVNELNKCPVLETALIRAEECSVGPVYSQAKVGDKKCYALWDAACDITMISEEFYLELEDGELYECEKSPSRIKVVRINGEELKVDGCYWITMDLGGRECRRPVWIVVDLERPCIIGQDTMREEEVWRNLEKRTIEVKSSGVLLAKAVRSEIPARKRKGKTNEDDGNGKRENTRYACSLQFGRISIEHELKGPSQMGMKGKRNQETPKLRIDNRSSKKDEVESNQGLMGGDWRTEVSGYKLVRNRKRKPRRNKVWRLNTEPKRRNSGKRSELTSNTYVKREAADRIYGNAMKPFIREDELKSQKKLEQEENGDKGDGKGDGMRIEQEITMIEPELVNKSVNDSHSEENNEEGEVNSCELKMERRSNSEIVLDLPRLLTNQGFMDKGPKSMVKVDGVGCQALWDIGSTIALVSKNLFDLLKGETLYEYCATEMRFKTPQKKEQNKGRVRGVTCQKELEVCTRPNGSAKEKARSITCREARGYGRNKRTGGTRRTGAAGCGLRTQLAKVGRKSEDVGGPKVIGTSRKLISTSNHRKRRRTTSLVRARSDWSNHKKRRRTTSLFWARSDWSNHRKCRRTTSLFRTRSDWCLEPNPVSIAGSGRVPPGLRCDAVTLSHCWTKTLVQSAVIQREASRRASHSVLAGGHFGFFELLIFG